MTNRAHHDCARLRQRSQAAKTAATKRALCVEAAETGESDAPEHGRECSARDGTVGVAQYVFSYLTGSEGKSQREKQGKAVRTGYYVSVFILFSRFKGGKWRHSRRIAPLQDRRRRSEYLSIMQDAQKGCPARPQRVKGRRRTLWGARCDE
jgi:hypothetical protein